MFSYLHLRSRRLQILILGLIVLTFYAYYRITTSDVRHPRTTNSQIIDPSSVQEALQAHPKISSESSALAPAENATPDTTVNQTHHVIGNASSTVVTVLSPSQNPSPPSPKIPLPSKPNPMSTLAFYVSGHSVTASEKCPFLGRNLNLTIVIMSAPSYHGSRTAIRQTWGHYGQRRDVSILFMIGATLDAKVEKSLEQEQNMFGDIIRGKFLDTYANLTLKTISMFEWVDNYCSEVKFLLKTDDDMFINVPRLLEFIEKHRDQKNVIYGRLASKWKPIRSQRNKYYVSREQFNLTVFPDFTTGPAYLMSSDVVHGLYEAAFDFPYLKLEDVYLTGIVAEKVGVRRVHEKEFLNTKTLHSPCNIQKGISIHMVKYGEQFDLWKKLLDGKTKCW